VQAVVLSAAREHARSAKAEYRVVIRARIVRDAASGISNEKNARRNGVHPDTVRKARRRAAAAKSAREAFVDAPRSGRPARIAVETRAALIQLACARPTPELELNVHSGPVIEEFNKRHGGRFHFVYTPKHASWMNQVEVWFSILQRRILKYGSFSSKRELEAAVMSFVVHWNEIERRPFRWKFRGEFAPRLPCAA
jgi:DNA-binding CsgD family transcriptional regulator